jgi:hypothetical protein
MSSTGDVFDLKERMRALEREARLPLDELLALEDARVVCALETRIAGKDQRGAPLAAAERLLFVVIRLDAEISNGGFDQYFFNSTGGDAPDAADACRAVGLDRHAKLVERAIAAVPFAMSADTDERREQLEALSEDATDVLEALDREWYALASSRPTDRAIATFARARRAELAI